MCRESHVYTKFKLTAWIFSIYSFLTCTGVLSRKSVRFLNIERGGGLQFAGLLFQVEKCFGGFGARNTKSTRSKNAKNKLRSVSELLVSYVSQ